MSSGPAEETFFVRVPRLATIAVGWSGPGVQRAGRVQAGPPTTADCEKAYKVACYQPARIRQAYDLPSVDARYFVSELALAIGDGKVILSRTGLGASLGNGVII
jgi:hypothetical protein